MSQLLPNDVLAEILSYLPAKAFFKLLPVCKTLYQLSSDSHFLLSQSYHNKAISGFFVDSCSIVKLFIPLDPNAGVPRSNIEFLRKREAIILGSAGGLVFFLQRKDRFDNTLHLWVCNPARGTRCQLPSPPGRCSYGGIAVRFMKNKDGVRTDYKLVYLTRNMSLLQHCRVYDSVAKAWIMDKEINLGGRPKLDLEHPVVCDDTVFWATLDLWSYTRTKSCIVAFDVRDGCTQNIPMPEDAVVNLDDTIRIAKWEGKSLCLIHYTTFACLFVLWVMKKTNDGAPEWVKVQEIRLAGLGFREPRYVSFVMLSEIMSTTLLVFNIDKVLCSYNINDGEVKKLSSLRYYYSPRLFPYSNTLQPCGEQEELLKAI
ncbi:hypothetical protein BHM03_00062340 [Ensete ventricosum]|nr:hypothetical protein BHM03_00062340 [Ensete ventricosum]